MPPERLLPEPEDVSECQSRSGADLEHTGWVKRSHGVGAAAGDDTGEVQTRGPGDSDSGRNDYDLPVGKHFKVYPEATLRLSYAAEAADRASCKHRLGRCPGLVVWGSADGPRVHARWRRTGEDKRE
jgi:hypothetical protein